MSPADYLKKPYARLLVPEDDGSFRAEIAEFPGCIALGSSPGEAYSELESVAEAWLASVIARGQPIPEPMEEAGYSGKLVLRLPKSLHRKATYAARRDGVSLNQFIINSLSEQVGIRTAFASFFTASAFSGMIGSTQNYVTTALQSWNASGNQIQLTNIVLPGVRYAGR